jgi:hypothetical protein
MTSEKDSPGLFRVFSGKGLFREGSFQGRVFSGKGLFRDGFFQGRVFSRTGSFQGRRSFQGRGLFRDAGLFRDGVFSGTPVFPPMSVGRKPGV